jgi:uncharacterized protein (DUF1778 family)
MYSDPLYNPGEEEGTMPKRPFPSRAQKKHKRLGPLMVRLDPESKEFLSQAAELRRVSVSDYVRLVTVGQARREVLAAREHTIVLSPAEQLAFWKALNEVPRLTAAQRHLASVMRGEA